MAEAVGEAVDIVEEVSVVIVIAGDEMMARTAETMTGDICPDEVGLAEEAAVVARILVVELSKVDKLLRVDELSRQCADCGREKR